MSPSSPLLDQYDRDGIVTPTLQRAMQLAKQKLTAGIAAQPTPGGQPASSPLVPPVTAPAPAPGAVPPPTPAAPAPSPHQQELTRLTTGETGKSGVAQIKNPWLRTPLQVLSALGDAFVPAITQNLPGGELHHRGLVNTARANVAQDTAQAKAETDRGHVAAENTELAARAEHERAQAEAARMVKPDTGETKTIETADGIMGWNPATRQYDILVGDAPGKNSTQLHSSSDGSVIAVYTDPKTGKTTHEVIYHGDPKVETEMADLEIAGKPHKVLVNKKTGGVIKDLGASGIKPSTQDYGTNFIDPATNTVVRVRPGQQAPAGGLTTSGFGGANAPTAASRTIADQATAIRAAGDKLIQEIDANKSVGNLGSYWTQAINGTPIADPAAASLMASLSSFAALQPKLHGFRSHEAMKEFTNIIGGIPKNPEALKAAIRSIQSTAEIMERMGKIKVPGEEGTTAASAERSAQGGYVVGKTYQGQKYLGGDPNDKNSWGK